MMRELELRIGSLRSRREIVIEEESPVLTGEEIVSIEMGEIEELEP